MGPESVWEKPHCLLPRALSLLLSGQQAEIGRWVHRAPSGVGWGPLVQEEDRRCTHRVFRESTVGAPAVLHRCSVRETAWKESVLGPVRLRRAGSHLRAEGTFSAIGLVGALAGPPATGAPLVAPKDEAG